MLLYTYIARYNTVTLAYTLHLEISGTYFPLLWCLLVSDIPAEHHMGDVKSVKSWKVFLNTNTLYLVICVTILTLRFYTLLYATIR